jgi:hypothetical protein
MAHLAVPQGARIWQLAVEMDVTAGRDELLARIDQAVLAGKKDYHRGTEAQR